MNARPDLSPAPGGATLAALVGIVATVSVFAISQGLSYPLLSFILQRQGVSPGLIGASAAMTPLGFIASAPFIPRMARALGPGRLAVACAAGAAVLLLLIGWTRDVAAWFPLRFLLGFLANPLYVVSETWMIAITPAAIRGRVMGLYTSIVSAGFALGPLVLVVAGTEGWPPFLIGAAAFVACGACLTAVMTRLPPMRHEAQPTSVAGFVRLAPLLIFAVVGAAGFEQALLALLGVYGEAHGLSERCLAALLSTFIAGNIALQMPLGALAERVGTIRTLAGCAVAATLGCALLPLAIETVLVWPMAFVWGAVTFGVYTMALIELGNRFTGALIITGNSAFALAWGFGGILAPPATGLALDVVGVQGLPLALGLMCGALAVAALASLRRGQGASP
jgi:MFS family permease